DQLVDDLFEEDYLDDCDLEECEHYEDTPEQDPEVLEDTPENLLQVLEDRQSLIVNLQKVMAEQPEELPGALPETSKDVDDQDDAPLPVKAVGSFEDILAAVGKSPHFCESSKTFATGCMQRLRDLVGSKTQVQGVRTNENMYNILTSQLCRTRQFNRHTAARGGRMYNWFAAQQSLVEKVADEPGDGPQAVLSSSVFRPICSKEPQLLLVKDIQGGIMRFEVMVCFSVFRGAVAREPGASRRLRVTKNLGINAPAEAVARILVLYLEWVPPNKETCTVQREDLGEMKQRGFYVTSTMARSKLVTPLDEVLGEIPIEEWGTRNGCCYFALPEKTMEFLREVEEGEINPMTFFLPKKKENEKQVVSTSEKQD
ncbi:unnamed protein product, partial [Durusdinium trenchii]